MGVWRKKCLMIMDYVNASIEIIRYIVSKYDTHGERKRPWFYIRTMRERERERERRRRHQKE